MELLFLIKFGYIVVVSSFILMIWISYIEGMEINGATYPPCYFNPLCSCSKSIPDLGIVHCKNVHMPRIPQAVNKSKVFMLNLENNGLRHIEPYFLQATGLYKLSIRENPLYIITDEAFLGLERSLWELDLSYDELTTVPNKAIRYLQKLRHLDLTGNEIIEIVADDWRGLEHSLEVLILADNDINYLPADAFSGLPLLDTIDLTGNNLREIDANVFRDGMGKLSKVLLGDNQLTSIPYQAVQTLKHLKYLDLSFNRINKMQPPIDPLSSLTTQTFNYNLNLDVLDLDYNQIPVIESNGFQYFEVVNKTYLDGNPIDNLEENAFLKAKIRELYIRGCGLDVISPLAFSGLENSLQILDLSGNNITEFDGNQFQKFVSIKSLILRDNLINEIKIEEFDGQEDSLLEFDFSGSSNGKISISNLSNFKRLRSASLTNTKEKDLTSELFKNFGRDVFELNINLADLKSIKNNAFQHLRGLRKLDLSENAITTIEQNGFEDVSYSLIYVNFAHGFSKSLSEIPKAFKILINIEDLNLSNNKLKIIPETAFYSMKKLKRLELQDNVIENVLKGTFQGDIHTNLEIIYLSFNSIKTIQQHSFVELGELKELHLDDNKIDNIERRAFMNLKNLALLSLKGNKISTISYEAFQNLPELEDLDLSYNSIKRFEFSMFDQVGTLSMFKVNASHNFIEELNFNMSFSFSYESACAYCSGSLGFHSNIKILDLSFNNITTISKQYFQPVVLSLTHLYLGHNYINVAKKEIFGNMPHLELLNLSHNNLSEIDFDTFQNTKKIQVLSVSYNNLIEISNDLFKSMENLRLVDFSHNKLKGVPDNLFKESGLERLDFSHNLLNRLHLSSMNVLAASTLCELDLSYNNIASVSHAEIFTKFKTLNFLDLSHNRLVQIDDAVFSTLPKLSTLDLSHNTQIVLETGRTFEGIEDTLLHLNLNNVSLTSVPDLSLPNLLSLSLGKNMLPVIPPEMASNLSSLLNLDLNGNDLTSIPVVTHSLPELRELSLASNPITTLTNNSLLGVADQLQHLDITGFELNSLETGVLNKLFALRTLKIGVYDSIKNYNIPRLLQSSNGLKKLEIFVEKEVNNFVGMIKGIYPEKLKSITLIGLGVTSIDDDILDGVKNPQVHFGLKNTSVDHIPEDTFNFIPIIRNISLTLKDNLKLKSVPSPFSTDRPGDSNKPFLIDLDLSGSYICDCSLGWIETWDRKRRQYLCESNNNEKDPSCMHVHDNIRSSLCTNKKNSSLIEVLKTELECGWSKSNTAQAVFIYLAVSIVITQII
nr:chaoptin isoform X1 [Onthophagus taurus]